MENNKKDKMLKSNKDKKDNISFMQIYNIAISNIKRRFKIQGGEEYKRKGARKRMYKKKQINKYKIK